MTAKSALPPFAKDGSQPGQYKFLCPFGQDTNPSLKINLDKKLYHCFVCDSGGNVLEFVMAMEHTDIITAARTLSDIGKVAGNLPDDARKAATAPSRVRKTANQPLSFALTKLDRSHPFIAGRGISLAMIATFGLGIASIGIMQGRLVFPIHSATGELVAYCGRYIGDDLPNDEPKYKQPAGFHKELELFNWHRIKDQASTAPVILVESFFSTVKLHEAGYRVASPMGHSLSSAQITLLQQAAVQTVILLFDGDDPGRDAIKRAGRELLAANINCIAPVVPEDFKPHRASSETLANILKPFVGLV